jgi:hypothetical protein
MTLDPYFQDAPEDSLEPYTFKSQAIDFHELCQSLGCKDVVVGAHDWYASITIKPLAHFRLNLTLLKGER